jgi:GNAT superfamily N-acetyltransferase
MLSSLIPTIRPAQETDTQAIANLLRSLGWFESERFEVIEARVKQHLALFIANPSHFLRVAEDEQGQIVGYISVHWLPYLFLTTPEGFLSELFVAETYRGQGLGKALLDTVVTAAKQRGCSRLHLITGRDRESYNRRFYPKQGWIEREKMANFIYKL